MKAPVGGVWDAIVVGLGAHGSSTLYHLAQRGLQVLGLEAQPHLAHSLGSSHGLSRIIRLCYFEHPSYVPLLRESYRLWRQLETASGADLMHITGCLSISAGPESAASAMSTAPDCFRGALASAQQHGLAHEVLSPAQAQQRFPAYRLPPGARVLFEPTGGYLVPEACIEAHAAQAQRLGAQLLCGVRVEGWAAAEQPAQSAHAASRYLPSPPPVEVHTSRETFRTRRLVLTAGGWMPTLVPELASLLAVERQVVGWFGVEAGAAPDFSPQRCPVFLLDDERGYYYGFPADAQGFKLGRYGHLGQTTSADAVDREVAPADEEVLRQPLARYFPGAAAGPLARASACTFTNTPDGHFLLDLHPRHGRQVVLGSACSGHGFKFASVVGEVLADLATLGSTPHDIALHRLDAARPGQEQLAQHLRQHSTAD